MKGQHKKIAVRVKTAMNIFITFSIRFTYAFADRKIGNLSPLCSQLISAVGAVSTASFEIYAKPMLSDKAATILMYINFKYQIPDSGHGICLLGWCSFLVLPYEYNLWVGTFTLGVFYPLMCAVTINKELFIQVQTQTH